MAQAAVEIATRGALLDLVAAAAGTGGTAMVHLQMRGVDTCHAELRARGIDVGDLGDRAYGMRGFQVVDPSGNRLAFGEPIEA